jgi:hypothetical protein
MKSVNWSEVSGQTEQPSRPDSEEPWLEENRRAVPHRLTLFYVGVLLTMAGMALFLLSILTLGFALLHHARLTEWSHALARGAQLLTAPGLLLAIFDAAFLLPRRRDVRCGLHAPESPIAKLTVALTAYNDEASISDAVSDFRRHPLVNQVIVVSNNSKDRTQERARAAGAIVVNEEAQGYGACVYRCLRECMTQGDTGYFVICEGDMTFRAFDLDKLVAYLPHADVVNGTRIVEQLRAHSTQLSTPIYYGNFLAGKLLEAKHFGKGTFTDVGTTYKAMGRAAAARLLPNLNPRVNLEFNAHFMDTVLACGLTMVECPITFHPRVGASKGAKNTLTAIRIGFRMLIGMTFGWRWIAGEAGASACLPHS